jgi:thiamine-phosphate pyrophosphorylase
MAAHCLLYYITDRTLFRGDEVTRRHSLLAKVAEAARAGVNYIQLREKDLSARELESLAREVLAVLRNNSALRTENRVLRTCNEPKTRLLINSRTDVALTAGADGVHLRSDDVSAHDVRQLLEVAHRPLNTEPFLIAASCHSAAEVRRAESEKADFAVFAPVFEKKVEKIFEKIFEKKDAPQSQPAGLAALHEACQARIPVVALGGVTLANAASCLQAGATGVAGIRLFQENKIEDVVSALRPL